MPNTSNPAEKKLKFSYASCLSGISHIHTIIKNEVLPSLLRITSNGLEMFDIGGPEVS